MSRIVHVAYNQALGVDLGGIMTHYAAKDRAKLLEKAPYLSMIMQDPMIQRFLIDPSSYKWHAGVIIQVESYLRSPDPQLRAAASELLDESSYAVPFAKVSSAFPPCFPKEKFIPMDELIRTM
jgi:hypothetical protein